jgi:DNA-binding CsgD family transcriptional regulator
MPRRVDVTLSDEEREVLERWARRPKSAQALALRCRIVLAAADGEQSKEIAERLGCTADLLLDVAAIEEVARDDLVFQLLSFAAGRAETVSPPNAIRIAGSR